MDFYFVYYLQVDMISNAVFIMPLIVIISTFYMSRYEWEAKTQMQKMGFILNLTENKHK